MAEVYTRKLKQISSNGSAAIRIQPSPAKRLHGIGLKITFSGGSTTAYDTLAEQLDLITEIRVLVGTKVRRRLSTFTIYNADVIGAGAVLRDYLILNGTTHDVEVSGSYGCQIYIPFAEDWFIENVADALAWNPAILGAPITVEVDCNTTYAMTVEAWERVSDDLDAVFPTRVGMVRRHVGGRGDNIGFPHTRGDGPSLRKLPW